MEWISVKDRLPITKDTINGNFDVVPVIVFSPIEGVRSDWFEAGNTISFWSCFNGFKDATHWMPLPAPPSEATNA